MNLNSNKLECLFFSKMRFLVFWHYQWAEEREWVCSESNKSTSGFRVNHYCTSEVCEAGWKSFLCWYYWVERTKNHPVHTNYSLRILNPAGNRSWHKNILHEISLAVSAKIVFLCGAFFLPIFKCNFVQVLKPPDAHLNSISSFSSSITASNNVKCVHATALILHSCSSFDHRGWKLGGIFTQSYASLPLLVFQD